MKDIEDSCRSSHRMGGGQGAFVKTILHLLSQICRIKSCRQCSEGLKEQKARSVGG